MSTHKNPPTSAQHVQEFKDLLDSTLQKQVNLEGQVVKGTVVRIEKDIALIDVKLKSEGRVPVKEFLPQNIQVGDEVEVFIDRYEGRGGDVLLSHERAKQDVSWRLLKEAFQSKKRVEGTITNQVKGGLTVDIDGTVAFLPGSQVDVRPIKDLSHFVGTRQPFLILKIDDVRNNVVVSRRAVLEESRMADRQKLLNDLEQGQRLEGVVKNLTDYGAFVDLGGIDGLLHITDIAWKRIQHPSEVISVGQVIQVVVTRFNKETQRISLGMKQLEKDPWTNIDERCKVGDRVKGTVTNVTDYGAFVEMAEGLEGLVHVGEMLWSKKNIDPRDVVTPGQEIEAMILEIDTAKRRISLGMKQCTENPIDRFAAQYPVGSEVEGEVKDVTEFGLIVQLPQGIDATIFRADLSWDASENALAKYSIGMPVRMKVTGINSANEMIGLSIKQLSEDPWIKKVAHWKKGDTVKAHVTAILDHGVEVDLGEGVKTVIQRSDLSRDREGQNPQKFSLDEEIEAKIVVLDPDAHHMVLSIKAQEIEDEKTVMEGYKEKGSSLGNLLEEALNAKKDS